jgi:hypothetical protein
VRSLLERLVCQLELRFSLCHRLLTTGQRGLAASQSRGAVSQVRLGYCWTLSVS